MAPHVYDRRGPDDGREQQQAIAEQHAMIAVVDGERIEQHRDAPPCRGRRRAASPVSDVPCRNSTDSGATHRGVVYARIADRPASTNISAEWVRPRNAAVCNNPIDSTTGRSARGGRRKPPVANNSARKQRVASDTLAVANHSGGMNARPTFMIGQFTPHSRMTRPSSSAARPVALASDIASPSGRGIAFGNSVCAG